MIFIELVRKEEIKTREKDETYQELQKHLQRNESTS